MTINTLDKYIFEMGTVIEYDKYIFEMGNFLLSFITKVVKDIFPFLIIRQYQT